MCVKTNLHVVPELEVRRKCKSLSHGDVAPRLEHHHRNRAPRKCIANNEFGNNIQPNLLVGNGLDHADRNDIDKSWSRARLITLSLACDITGRTDNKREHECPDWELSRPDFNGDYAKHEH